MKKTREYKEEDYAQVLELLAQLQHSLSEIDPLNQHREYQDFDREAYLENQIKKVAESKGKIFVLEEGAKIIGVITGWITEIKNDSIDYYPQTFGYISDLFVSEEARGSGAGKSLLESMEGYFRDESCKYVAVSYLVENTKANQFYEKNGYSDYAARKVKKLS